MKAYTNNVQDIHEDVQWPKVNSKCEQLVPFAFFQKLEDKYEIIKAEVLARKMISKDDIQELLISPTKEVTKFNAFIIKFKAEMEYFKECHLKLDIKKEYVFNVR